MRWLLIPHNNTAAAVAFAFGLSAHQHFDPAGQLGDFGLLPDHDLGQVIDRAGQMGDMFFKFLHGVFLHRIGRV